MAAPATPLHVEADEYGVAVSHDVVAAFEADLRLLSGPGPRTGGDDILPVSYLGRDKAALHVGVDAPGGLPHRGALAYCPGPGFFLCGGKEGDETKQPVRRAHELVETGRLHPEHREILPSLVLGELGDFGFELRTDTYNLGTLAAAVLFDLRAVTVPVGHGLLIHVRHVECRLCRYEGSHSLGHGLRRRVDPCRTPVREVVA